MLGLMLAEPIQKMCGAGSVPGPDFLGKLDISTTRPETYPGHNESVAKAGQTQLGVPVLCRARIFLGKLDVSTTRPET